MIHIVKTNDNEYLVVEPYIIKENHYARIHYRSFSLDNANRYANMLLEEGPVPVNAMAAGPGAGNIATFTPIMKFKNALARVRKKRKQQKHS